MGFTIEHRSRGPLCAQQDTRKGLRDSLAGLVEGGSPPPPAPREPCCSGQSPGLGVGILDSASALSFAGCVFSHLVSTFLATNAILCVFKSFTILSHALQNQ